MLKLSKKADYGLIAMRRLVTNAGNGALSAADIAEEYHISATLMAKILQKLARKGLVVARHGSSGGYQLARDPATITALEVIDAIDGPLRITSCVTSRGECGQTSTCTVREPLRLVNDSILQVLSMVTLSQMAQPGPASGVVELRT